MIESRDPSATNSEPHTCATYTAEVRALVVVNSEPVYAVEPAVRLSTTSMYHGSGEESEIAHAEYTLKPNTEERNLFRSAHLEHAEKLQLVETCVSVGASIIAIIRIGDGWGLHGLAYPLHRLSA